jgi:hypothetical protein
MYYGVGPAPLTANVSALSTMTTTAKDKLSAKLAFATVLMWACMLANAGPLLYALCRLVASTRTPEGGFEGMAIVFTLLTWGIVLLFPLYGFSEALRWRLTLQDELRKLEGEENAGVR